MNDLDRLLSESLKGAGDSYLPRNAVAAREEFAARRKRRFVWQLSGGVALAGAAVAAALFFASAEPLVRDEVEPGPMEVAALDILTRFEVGEEPLAIGAGKDFRLWIASREGGSVSRIDLNTGDVEKIDLPGANEIVVGAENVWVSGEAGNYLRINEAMPEIVDDGNFVENAGGSQLLDLAVGGDAEGAAWAVDLDGCVWELTTPREVGCSEPGFFPTDVATDADEAWILDSGRGYARQVNADEGVNDDRPSDYYEGLPSSEFGDMTIVGNSLWVSGSGRIVTVDLETSERRNLEIDGDYADLAVGPETVWALAGWADGDQRARVYELSHDLEVIGISDILRGEPSDLVADANGVWITIRYRNEVIYLSRGETAPPVPPVVEDEAAERGDVVMVFGKDGDIWAAYADGTIGALTQTPNEEAFPVLIDSLDGTGSGAVIFERGFEGGTPKLVHIDLSTLEEQELVDGYRPAAGSPDEQAWLGTSASVPTVVVGTLFSDGPNVLTIEDVDGEPVQLSQLAWDAGSTFLYGLTTGKSPGSVVEIDPEGDGAEAIQRPQEGARYTAVAPADIGGTITVIRVCCDDAEGPMTVELGELIGSSGSMEYRTIADLSDLPWAGFDDMTLTPAAGLSAMPNEDGTVTWGTLDASAWVVSDGVRGFLVDDSGEARELPWEIHGGIDVNEDRNLR